MPKNPSIMFNHEPCLGVNTKTSKERIATIEITLEVENIEQLNKVIKAIRKVDSVYEVNRKK